MKLDRSIARTMQNYTPGGENEAYDKLVAILESLIYVKPRSLAIRETVGLRVMRALLARLGSPERNLRVVHVAGSKGKGSTVLVAEAILREAGYRTGTFTSPHLERWTERIRIDGEEVEASRLLDTLERLRPHIDALQQQNPANPLTFFEALTAAALMLFVDSSVDWVLLETGLGGRLDATNVVVPRVACLTSVELEHTDRLGDKISEIAREKAGVAKANVPLVVGPLGTAAYAAVRREALARGATIVAANSGYSTHVENARNARTTLAIETPDFRFATELGSASNAFANNVATAIVALDAGGVAPRFRLLRAARRVLPRLRLAGRCEILETRPPILIDSAHTEASALDLAEAVKRIERAPVHLVVSVSAIRNLSILARILGEIGEPVTITRAESSRSLAAEEVARAFRLANPGRLIRLVTEPAEALSSAWENVPAEGILCVAGSVYLAGFARSQLLPRESSRIPGKR